MTESSPIRLPSDDQAYLGDQPAGSGPRTGLAALNAGALVVAGLYLGRELLVPIVLAVLLAVVRCCSGAGGARRSRSC